MYQIKCAEIWGGIRSEDTDICAAGITASLYSGACDGGKGGDVYYFSVCESDMLTRIAIADVVGHGEAVSDMSGWMYGALESRMNSTAGNDVLAELNGLACERGFDALTTAAVVGYYTADNHAYFSYAGHHATLVRHSDDGKWAAANLQDSPDQLANLPLGVDPNVVYTQGRMPLNSGDRMFLYTDGVTEAPDKDTTLFGEAQLMSVLRETSGGSFMEIKRAVLDAIRKHTGGPLTHDDVTLLVIEVN